MKDFPSEIQQKIQEADSERLNGYIEMFDRVLLYNIAAASLPSEVIDELIRRWEKTVKTTIDTESKHRTHFLESTPQGRVARKQDQPDGEDLRLLFLSTLDTAKDIVSHNLQRNEEDLEEFDPDDFGY